MSKLTPEEREIKGINSAIDFYRGFLEALESLDKLDDIDAEIEKCKELIYIYEDRLNQFRKTKKQQSMKKGK